MLRRWSSTKTQSAGIELQLVEYVLVGTWIGLEDAGMRRINDRVEALQDRQTVAEACAIEQVELVRQDGEPESGVSDHVDGVVSLGTNDGLGSAPRARWTKVSIADQSSPSRRPTSRLRVSQ